MLAWQEAMLYHFVLAISWTKPGEEVSHEEVISLNNE